MGRQINFFMLPNDEEDFLNKVISTGPVVILAPSSKSERIIPLNTPDTAVVYLYNQRIGKLKPNYVKNQEKYVIDVEKSSVIEFTRCQLRGKKLLEGRLWMTNSYVSKNIFGYKWKAKPEEFTKWYMQISGWLKRRYINVGGTYFSKGVVRNIGKIKPIGATVSKMELKQLKDKELSQKLKPKFMHNIWFGIK